MQEKQMPSNLMSGVQITTKTTSVFVERDCLTHFKD